MENTDYPVCGGCGIYAAAVLTDGKRSWATPNINLLDQPMDDRFTAAIPVDYGAEDRDARIVRFAPATA